MKATGKQREELTAEAFADSVGVGSYRIDLHPSTGGDNYIDVSSLPFQIPLGALIPQARGEPAAGLQEPRRDAHHQRLLPPAPGGVEHRRGRRLPGRALPGHRSHSPRQVRNDPKLLRDFQSKIQAQGIEIAWPRLTPR